MPGRWLFLGLALGLGLVPASAQTGSPAFQPAPCDLPGVTADLAPRLRCGTVAVPRDRDSPEAGVFRLAVVIIRALSGQPQADPVVYIAGGPGSPLTSRAALLAGHEAGIVAPDRDLILVDQRGVGRSEPALCPGLARRHLAIFAAGTEQQATVQAWRRSYADCRQQMAAAGLQPEWFGTQIAAADFDAVRQALGIGRWNIYAISYGTSVAMTSMALFPDSLRAVVLDSVQPPDPLPQTLPQTFGHALTNLFAACGSDPACAATHPDLAATFDAAVRGLDAEALPVPVQPGLGFGTFELRGQAFRLIVNRALYSRPGMAALPAFIVAARDRNATAMAALVGVIARGYEATSIAASAAVGCRDRPSWHESLPSDDAPVSAFVPGICQDWSAPGPPPLMAANATTPSLLLAGAVDPITPPSFARLAAAAMGSRATMVEFAHVGHGVQPSSPCAERLVTAFIRDPSRLVDPACAAEVLPVSFK